GSEARRAEALAPFGLKIGVLDAPGCAASALKMSYAGITKGLIALGSSMILAAERAGISDALRAELGASQANLLTGFARSIPDMFGKAYRWVKIRLVDRSGDRPAGDHRIQVGVADNPAIDQRRRDLAV